ncbi:MAG: PHP domain-containing protein [Pleurocapsa sp.]
MVAISSHKIKAQDTLSLKKVWETIDVNSCPRFYNFHMHTVFSDGKLTPSQLIQQAMDIGIKGLAITDHHSVGGYEKAQQHLNDLRQRDQLDRNFHLWTGVEITSKLQDVEVHILGYGFAPEHPALKKYLRGNSPQGKDAEAKQVINSLHQAGGLVVLAHPARYRRPAAKLIPLAANLGVDGVETYYAYNNPQPWKPSPVQTKQVKQLASQYDLYQTCGTDTHGLDLLRRM